MKIMAARQLRTCNSNSRTIAKQSQQLPKHGEYSKTAKEDPKGMSKHARNTPNRESQRTVSLNHKSPWDATHSGSQRSQCKIMQISMGRCAPAIIYFVCLMFGVFYGSKIRNHIVDAASMQSLF